MQGNTGQERIKDLITGKFLFLKEPKLNDYEKIKNIWEDEDTMKDVGGVILLPEDKYIEWHENMIIKGKDRNRYFLIIDKESSNCLGEISFHRYNINTKTADLNIKILKRFRGQGKAKESLDLLLDFYFNTFKGLIIQDHIGINNINGLNVLINYGFEEKYRNDEEILIELTKSKFNEKKLARNGSY